MTAPTSQSSAPIKCNYMGNSFRIVAFYTWSTPYEGMIEDLRKDCRDWGLNWKFVPYPNTGRWVRNAGLKPIFIQSMMEEFPDENIIYVDADARIRQFPTLFDDFDGDIGVHYHRGQELLSGTIFLRNNAKVRKLVDRWVNQQRSTPDVWDQKVLDRVIKADAKTLGIKVTNLPPTYTQIFDTMKHLGQPVIEHFQASRRCKSIVEQSFKGMIRPNIPTKIGNVRVRESQDGSLYITRHDAIAIKFLDQHARRLPGQLRWLPIFLEQEKIETLKPYFDNQLCYIVGKGPSLDYLRHKHFQDPSAPVIGLNEAVHQVEKLGLPNRIFGIQQDAKLRGTCYPLNGIMFVSIKAANFYSARRDVYIFDSRHYKLSLNSLSVSAAIKISKALGVTGFELLCFDACVNQNLDYAKCVGYNASWGGDKTRFLSHRAKIMHHVADLPLTFTIPEALAVEAAGKSRQ